MLVRAKLPEESGRIGLVKSNRSRSTHFTTKDDAEHEKHYLLYFMLKMSETE